MRKLAQFIQTSFEFTSSHAKCQKFQILSPQLNISLGITGDENYIIDRLVNSYSNLVCIGANLH